MFAPTYSSDMSLKDIYSDWNPAPIKHNKSRTGRIFLGIYCRSGGHIYIIPRFPFKDIHFIYLYLDCALVKFFYEIRSINGLCFLLSAN